MSVPTIPVSWKDSGASPKLSELASYQLFLCAGGNDATNYVNLTYTHPDDDQTLIAVRFNSLNSAVQAILRKETPQ